MRRALNALMMLVAGVCVAAPAAARPGTVENGPASTAAAVAGDRQSPSPPTSSTLRSSRAMLDTTGASASTAEDTDPPRLIGSMKIDVSNSSQGTFLQLVPGLGIRSGHWGIDAGVPLDSSRSSGSSAGATSPGATTSQSGLGDIYASLSYAIESDRADFTTALIGTAPTGDSSAGLGAGQATWNWTNHLDRALDRLTPFVDVSLGNSINPAATLASPDQRARGKQARLSPIPTAPYTTVGNFARVDLGFDIDAFRLVGFSVSAYDTIPWGDQTTISHFVVSSNQPARPTPPTNPGSRDPKELLRLRATKGQRFFEVSAVTQSAASLIRDNGFGASMGVSPARHLSLSLRYSHSVPMKLDVVSLSASTSFVSPFRRP